ncbi:hypothetical protein Tco_1210320 [Tanacetum coccineum]
MHDTSNSSRTYITHVVDANIRPVNDQVPSAEVHLTTPHNVLANEQKHTDQSEPRYDTYLLEKVDSNTTPDSTNMCHRGGEIDQDAKQYQAKSPLLKAELVKSKEMIEKEMYNELLRSDSNVEYLRTNLNIKGMSNSRRTSLSNVDYMLCLSIFVDILLQIRWQKRIFLHLNLQDEMNRSFIAQNSYRLERETFFKSYRRFIAFKLDEKWFTLSADLYDKLTADDQEKSKVIEESDYTIPDPSHQTVTSTPPVIAPFTDVSSTKARIVSGPDLEPMQEDQTGSNSGKLHVSLAGPNPEHMDDEFLATAYLKVHENLKLITDERVIEENPESHSGSMSSMKNLDDTYNFGDQFLYDKLTEDDQEKSKVIEESDSTIPDPNLIEKYSALPGPESIKNQESEKSPKEIIRIKREQGEEKQDSTYSIRCPWIRKMQLRLKTTRESSSIDDDEVTMMMKALHWIKPGRSAKRIGPNQPLWSAQPPSKDDHQSSKKPRESDAYASKQHPDH